MTAQKSILFKARLVFGFPVLFAVSVAWAEGGGDSSPANNGSGSCVLNDELTDLPAEAQNGVGQIQGAGGKPPDLSAWKQKREECKNKNYDAQKQCLEACSANAQKGLSGAKAISGLMDIVNGLTNKTCGQQQQASNEMKDGYESYSAACKATQAACNTACAEAEKEAKTILSQLGSACAGVDTTKMGICNAGVQAIQAAVQKDSGKEMRFVAGKVDQCQRDFSNRLAGAAEVLKGIGQMLGQGKQCEDESVAASEKTKTCAELSEAERLQRQDCICEISSFNPGCENAGGSSNSPTFGGSEFGSPEPTNSNNVEASTPKADPTLFPSAGGGGTGGAGAGGMYAGGMGGPQGAAAASADKEGDEEKKKDANIFAGDAGGGGGGGGSWGFGSGSGSDSGAKAAGAGAGMRGLAGKPADPTLTGAGGRDNWQKVKLRYTDNRPTFLDEQ